MIDLEEFSPKKSEIMYSSNKLHNEQEMHVQYPNTDEIIEPLQNVNR